MDPEDPLITLQHAAAWLARQRFSSTAYRLILLLVANCLKHGRNPWIRLTQTEIASQLNLSASNISRSLRELEVGRAIERGPRIAGAWTWRINPQLFRKDALAPIVQILDSSSRRAHM
jgi:Winged helix-turn-helix DNA-binding